MGILDFGRTAFGNLIMKYTLEVLYHLGIFYQGLLVANVHKFTSF